LHRNVLVLFQKNSICNLKGSTIPNSNNSDVKKKDELLNRTALVGKILRNAENNRNFQDLKVQFFSKIHEMKLKFQRVDMQNNLDMNKNF